MVWCNKRAIYFPGMYDSEESRDAYYAYCKRLRGEVPDLQPLDETVLSSLIVHFQTKALPALPKSERQQFGVMLDLVIEIFGADLIVEFGPLKLKRAREIFAEQQVHKRNRPWSRTQINKQTRRLVKVFKWGVSEELVDVTQYHALALIEPLKKSDLQNRDAAPVRPVSREIVEKTKAKCSPTIAAMIELQTLTGMRSGNLCSMRACDIDRSREVWEYIPAEHKSAWREQKMFIALGPKCQAILFQFLHSRGPEEYLFSPRDSALWKSQVRWRERKSPRWLSAAAKRGRINPRLRNGYNPHSYRHAVKYATVAAGVEDWHPHQLRHNRGTDVRSRFNAEAARVSLGHATLSATEIYAEADMDLARKVAREMG